MTEWGQTPRRGERRSGGLPRNNQIVGGGTACTLLSLNNPNQAIESPVERTVVYQRHAEFAFEHVEQVGEIKPVPEERMPDGTLLRKL